MYFIMSLMVNETYMVNDMQIVGKFSLLCG